MNYEFKELEEMKKLADELLAKYEALKERIDRDIEIIDTICNREDGIEQDTGV